MLGHFLFLILKGDVDKEVTQSHLSSFADDTNLGKTTCTLEDVSFLHIDLDSVYEWARRNKMSFNEDKFGMTYDAVQKTIINSTRLPISGDHIAEFMTHVKSLMFISVRMLPSSNTDETVRG